MSFLSTKTPLAGNGTVTLGPVQTDQADRITGIAFANVAGTVFVEQSFDGANFDLSTSIPVTANTGAAISVEIVAPFIQVRYVNGVGAQGTFRLYAHFSSAGAR